MQRPKSTPLKSLPWQTPRNRRQLRHQTNAAIDIFLKTGASAINLIRKLSQQTKAAFARAKIVEIEAANLRTKYAGKKPEAMTGPGGRKKLTKGTIPDWRFLEKMEMEERKKEEAVAAGAKAKAERARAKEGKRSGAARAVPKAKVCSEWPSNI